MSHLRTFLIFILLHSSLSNAASFNLFCRPVGKGQCYTANNEKVCFNDISIKKLNRKSSTLSYSKTYMNNTQKSEYHNITNESSFSMELSDFIDGIIAVWDEGEFWTKMIRTPQDEYVGTITLEEDFPVTILCQSKK